MPVRVCARAWTHSVQPYGYAVLYGRIARTQHAACNSIRSYDAAGSQELAEPSQVATSTVPIPPVLVGKLHFGDFDFLFPLPPSLKHFYHRLTLVLRVV